MGSVAARGRPRYGRAVLDLVLGSLVALPVTTQSLWAAFPAPSWTQASAPCAEAVLEPAPGAPLELFGSAASFALSGATAIVGSVSDDTLGTRVGSVHVFDRQGPGWSLTTRLFPPQPAPFTSLGTSVAIAGDTLFAGTRADSDDGSVLIYRRQGGVWMLSLIHI